MADWPEGARVRWRVWINPVHRMEGKRRMSGRSAAGLHLADKDVLASRIPRQVGHDAIDELDEYLDVT